MLKCGQLTFQPSSAILTTIGRLSWPGKVPRQPTLCPSPKSAGTLSANASAQPFLFLKMAQYTSSPVHGPRVVSQQTRSKLMNDKPQTNPLSLWIPGLFLLVGLLLGLQL